ncbi:RB1-inducible coiled-coil protein 1-like isoform X2 [Paramacrobiotus metropolitanus]|uniref:RB1-inducible coiled-coil protein 1-like isoform X2 n=1 Tax=Paramacrobiotus metropolitanus TaxID=2943436 RepID=UPI00244635E3|nr:RB1-inducible coiled-coil protein 1-like isoform X2 [Paramacrobiotus metropolitanus]
MLYVFWVERGIIITLNVDVAVDTVGNLKSVLSNPQRTGIPADSQVLLISGGDCLQDDKRVAHYQGTGTDTNPIFLFNRAAIEADQVPEFSAEHLPHVPDEREARENMENVLALPTNLNSISIRTQLAQQYHEYARELNKQCTTLVQEQHLQHQGWQAVMANLEDVIAAFLKRLERFRSAYVGYLEKRDEHVVKLDKLTETMEVLGKITLFPSLLRLTHQDNEKVSGEKDSSGDTETVDGLSIAKSTVEPWKSDEITVLDWISAKDPEHSLHAVAEGCRKIIEAFDEALLEEVDQESKDVVEPCNNTTMKEIKGLDQRLYGLDQLLSEAKKLVLEQKETAEILFKFQSRMTGSGAKDNQMLKEMSDASTEPFAQLLRGHVKLCELRRRCLSAKQELCKHLHSRLKWVVVVENRVSEVDDKIRIYFENIRRIRRLLLMVDQVNSSPQVFILAVMEVLRRKRYAREFIQWARGVSEKAVAVHTKETDARKGFLAQHGKHFLLSLFPGLDILPPQFAPSPPVDFDTALPSLTPDDLENLRLRLPEFEEYLRSQDDLPFRSKSTESEESSVFYSTLSPESEGPAKDGTLETTAAAFSSSILDRREAELEEMRNQVDHLKGMSNTAQLSLFALKRIFDVLRNDLTTFKEDCSSGLNETLSDMAERWANMETVNTATKETLEKLQQQNIDLTVQAESYRLQGETAQKLLLEMQEALKESERKFTELRDEKDELQRNLDDAESNVNLRIKEKESSIVELQNRLNEKEAEMETLRALLESKEAAELASSPPVMSPLPSFIGMGEMPRQDSLTGAAMMDSMSMSVAPVTPGACRCVGPCTCPSGSQPLTRQKFVLGGGAMGLQSPQSVISLSSCNVGDLVLFVFNWDFRQFAAYLPFKRSLYLLHTDSQSELGLSIPQPESQGGGNPTGTSGEMRTWSVGEVLGKEYVLTKKVPNRYGLKIGTKFYRVRAKAWSVTGMLAEPNSEPGLGTRVTSAGSLPQPPVGGSSSASLQSAGQIDAQPH